MNRNDDMFDGMPEPAMHRRSETALSVSEITRRIRGVLEMGFSDIAVQGEISNFKLHSSGHFYFTLRDEGAQIAAVMWRSRNAGAYFTPQDGMKVIARGNISVYEQRGQYQIDVVKLEPLGVGELQVAFERLKRKLAADGLFDQARKRELPEFPDRIGIVTSPTGAAIQDMLNVLSRRFPAVEVVLYPVRVQGASAAEEIAEAIKDFNEFGDVDLLVVGRGGGSLEDLWAFNEEVVARAIYESAIPIVSAVGHEVDFTIADFVADLRAPTPSAAAELIVRDQAEVVDILRSFSYTAHQSLEDKIASGRDNIASLLGSYSFNRPFDIMREFSQRLDDLDRTLDRLTSHRLALSINHIHSLEHRILALDPNAVLRRGYTMVRRNGKYVGTVTVLTSGDRVDLRFHDGEAPAIIEER
jgi:exodeoxyribonuclease VII large subunit